MAGDSEKAQERFVLFIEDSRYLVSSQASVKGLGNSLWGNSFCIFSFLLSPTEGKGLLAC